MKIGLNGTSLVQKASVDRIVTHAQAAHADGFASYWLAEHPTGGFDALTVLAAVALAVPELKLGTAIIPTMPRHPMVLAGQAVTVNNLANGRLTLGIGLSHEPMMAQLGIGFDKPIRHLKEYLSVLMPLIESGQVDFTGETLSCQGQLFRASEQPLKVVAAALGPQALGVTGRMAHGTILAWVGARTIGEHIAPRIREAAARVGRPEPEIVATLPVCVTGAADTARAKLAKGMTMYGQLPSYQAMFEREGVSGPADVAIIGSRAEVTDRINALAAAGVTEFTPTEFYLNPDEQADTRALLRDLCA